MCTQHPCAGCSRVWSFVVWNFGGVGKRGRRMGYEHVFIPHARGLRVCYSVLPSHNWPSRSSWVNVLEHSCSWQDSRRPIHLQLNALVPGVSSFLSKRWVQKQQHFIPTKYSGGLIWHPLNVVTPILQEECQICVYNCSKFQPTCMQTEPCRDGQALSSLVAGLFLWSSRGWSLQEGRSHHCPIPSKKLQRL